MKTTSLKFLHATLAVLMLCATGLATTACSDSDDQKSEERIVNEEGKTYVPDSLLTNEERYQLACQSAVMGIMQTLTGVENVTPDVVNQNLEPTYGQILDGESSTVRVVKCAGTDESEQLFRAIACLDSLAASLLYTPTPDGYELSLKDLPILPDGKLFSLGTLTFHRDGGPRRYGYVEVEIPCIPHLERIDYLSAEAFPDNANSPYQLGDIVRVESGNTKNLCSGYYVCIANNGYRSTLVHMRHGKNPGGDESINADGDSEGCWRPHNNDHGHQTSLEDIKDYVSFILDNKAKVNNIKAFLESKAYNIKPSQRDKLSHIFPENFNNDKGVAYTGATARIHYNGYITDEYAWVPAYNYRKAEYAEVPNGCNSRGSVSSGSKKYVKDKEWNEWVGSHEFTMNVIHTDEIVKGAVLEYSPTNDRLELGIHPQEATIGQLGWCYADDGYLYETADEAIGYGHTPLGVLAFVNTGKGEWMDKVTEKENGYGHGLVLSYKWANSGRTCRMNPSNGSLFTEETEHTNYVENNLASASEDFNGLIRTEMLQYSGSYAARAARTLAPAPPANTSGWFIPSTGQWMAMLCNDRNGGLSGLGNGKWSKDASDTAADNSVFVIRNSNDWDTFRRMINEAKGNKRINAMLAADISTVYTAALTETWTGTFNGNGHTINVTISGGSLCYVGLFRYAKDFTIKNLHVKGTIKGADGLAGLVGYSTASSGQHNTIENCWVSTELTYTGSNTNADCVGGFIGNGNQSPIYIKNCLFDGAIKDAQIIVAAAFIANQSDDVRGNEFYNNLEYGSYPDNNGFSWAPHVGMNFYGSRLSLHYQQWANGYESQYKGSNNWSYHPATGGIHIWWKESNYVGGKSASDLAKQLGTDNWQVDASGKVVPRMIDETVNPWYSGSNVAVGGNPITTIEKFAPKVFGRQDVWTSSANSATTGVWLSTYFKEPYFSWQGDVAKECYVLPVFAY